MSFFTIAQDQSDLLKKLYLYPNADGGTIEWTPNIGNNWQCVDDNRYEIDNDVTYVSCATDASTIDTYGLPASGLGADVTISYVKLHSRVKSSDSFRPDDNFYLLCNGVQSNPFSLLNAWTDYSYVWTTTPATASDWSVASLDALEIGIECDTLNTNREYDYTYRPTGTGALLGITSETPGGADHWDVTSDQNDATYVKNPIRYNTWQYDTYTIDDQSDELGEIDYITVYAKCEWGTIKVGLRDDAANEVWSGEKNVLTKATKSQQFTTAPDGGAWTWAKFNNLELGIGLKTDKVGHDCKCFEMYAVAHTTDASSIPEVRCTSLYVEVGYYEEIGHCSLTMPEEVSVDHNRNINMINFWNGEREVYDVSRNGKTMVLTGTEYEGYTSDPCAAIDCIKTMAKYGEKITLSGLSLPCFNGDFKIRSFGWYKRSEKPIVFDWLLELEYEE